MHSWSHLAVVRSTGEEECWWASHCHSSFMHRQMKSEGSIEHTWQNRKGGVDGKRRPHSTCLTGICLSRPGTRSRWEGSFSRCSMLKEACLKLLTLSDLPFLYSLIMFILYLMEGCLWMVYRYDIDKQKRVFSFPYREVKSWFGAVVLVSFPPLPIFLSAWFDPIWMRICRGLVNIHKDSCSHSISNSARLKSDVESLWILLRVFRWEYLWHLC